MNTSRRVGLVGVGLLGSAIASRLLKAGWDVLGCDLDPTRREALLSQGGRTCEDPSEVFRNNELIVLSLPNSEVVSKLLHSVSAQLGPNSTVIDTTTGDPEQMIGVGRFLADLNAGYVEASVAGSSDMMRRGAARVFLGGEPERVASADALLDAIAPMRFHLGLVGAASRFKLIHNMLLGLNRAALAETLVFAESLGFDASDTVRVLLETPAASAALSAKGEKMAQQDYEPQARLSQHLKDVRLILAAAAASGAPTPLSTAHEQLLEDAEQQGYGGSDNSAVIEAFRNSRNKPQ